MRAKLDTARVFERIFEIYKDQFTLLIPAALVVFVPVAIINGIIYAGGVTFIGVFIIAAVGAIATYWFQGMVVEAARDILDGKRDHTVGSLVQSASPVIAPLLIAGILAGLGIGIGLVLLIVPGLFLLTIWAVIAPVIVIERTGALESFGRSRDLVRGSGWQVFGVIVVLFLIQVIIGAVIQALTNSISDSFVGFAIGDLILRLIVGPLTALAAAVMFFELKGLRGEPIVGTGSGGAVLVGEPGAGEPGAGTPARAPEAPGGPQAPPPPGGPPPQAPPPTSTEGTGSGPPG